jgi:hypothetical protein
MTAFSYSISVDPASQSPEAITVGTQTPNAGDIELRVNRANLKTRQQVILALEVFRRRLAGNYGTQDTLTI